MRLFPGLVEDLHDAVVDPALVGHVEETPQEPGLGLPAGLGLAEVFAVARPAHFREEHRLARKRLLHLLVAVEDPADRVIERNLLPVRQHVDGNEVHVLDQFGIFDEHVPGFGRADRHAQGGTDAVQVADHFLNAEVAAIEGLVADDHPLDGRRIALGVGDQVVDLILVALVAAVEPGAGGHLVTQAGGHAGDDFHPIQGRVRADALGLAFEEIEVVPNFLRGRELVFDGVLVFLVGAERDVVEHALPPGLRGLRAVENRPQRNVEQAGDADDGPRGFTHTPEGS